MLGLNVSLTTMTRMVEEQRLKIGTLKALGYSKRTIIGKYLRYALFATLIGGILGASCLMVDYYLPIGAVTVMLLMFMVVEVVLILISMLLK